MLRAAIATLLVVPALSLGLTAQNPPTFQTATELVEVGAVVVDGRGQPVAGLTKNDFAIEEDGRRVAVSTFAAVDADAPEEGSEGRFVILLLDDSDAPILTTRIKAIARQFADRMTARDTLAVMTLNGSKRQTTNEVEAIRAQIEHFRPRMLALPSFARVNKNDIAFTPDLTCSECGPPARIPPSASVNMPRHALDTISSLARQVSHVQHWRKSIVCIGRAGLFDVHVSPARPGFPYGWLDAVHDAATADVSVYVLDPAGLSFGSYDGALGLAGETGGRAFVNTNMFGSAVDQIWQETGHYYLLGYDAGKLRKRTPHSIKVTVDKPGLEVRARRTRA